MNDHKDRLVHVLLEETVGGQAPPDVSDRVLARAFPRRRRRWALPVAAAATVAVVVGAWALLAGRYPAPTATGGYTVVGGGEVARGATLRTDDRSARVELGGYCSVDVRPNSQVRLGGWRNAEKVYLESGAVECRVRPDGARFSVRSRAGEVVVTGTAFSVELIDDAGAPGGERMAVDVTEGSVICSGEWGTATLAAGERAVLPAVERAAAAVAAAGRAADGEGGERLGPRDGEGQREGARDGEVRREGTRDGEGRREGPRDGEVRREGPRDGDAPREGGARDGGERREGQGRNPFADDNRERDGDAPREGPRDGDARREGPRDGEGRREGPHDGDVRREGPRDGDAPREGPRDGDARREGAREGEAGGGSRAFRVAGEIVAADDDGFTVRAQRFRGREFRRGQTVRFRYPKNRDGRHAVSEAVRRKLDAMVERRAQVTVDARGDDLMTAARLLPGNRLVERDRPREGGERVGDRRPEGGECRERDGDRRPEGDRGRRDGDREGERGGDGREG